MKTIKKVITALMNEEVNKKLKENTEIEIATNDLLYQEAVIEYINNNNSIDFLLLNEDLPGQKIEEFIDKIPNINIILFVDKLKENTKKLLSKNVYRIYQNGEVSIEDIVKDIKEKPEEETAEELKKEIDKLKRIIEEKQNIQNKANIREHIKRIFKENKRPNCQLISIVGQNMKNNAIFSKIMADKVSKKRKKTLLIDMDIINQNIIKILNKSEILEKNLNIENHIIKKHKYLDFINGANIIFKINENISIKDLSNILKKLKNNYDYIIVNSSLECFFEFNKKILEESNLINLLVDNNIFCIKNMKNLLKIYWNEWKISKNKFWINIIQTNKSGKKYQLKIINQISCESFPTEEMKIEENSKIKYQKDNKNNILNKINKRM